jgi:hypothetical protein
MLINLLCVFAGAFIMYIFFYVSSIGQAISALKQTQQSCAALFVASEEGLQQVLYLKYMAMEESGRSSQNITAQKYIDQLNIDNIKKSIMKTYVEAFPSTYSHTIEYRNWEELENYVDKITKENRKKR